jgi:hypothetical protein
MRQEILPGTLSIIIIAMSLVPTARAQQNDTRLSLPVIDSISSLGKSEPINGDPETSPLIAFRNASYSLGLERTVPHQAVTSEEKVFNFRFTLANSVGSVFSINNGNPKVVFQDMRGFQYDVDEFRLTSDPESAEAFLLPYQKLNINAVARIPADAWIVKAFVSVRSQTTPLEIAVDSVEPLPSEVSADGRSIVSTVPGKRETWYPLGTIDVRVDDVEILEDPLGRSRPQEGEKTVAVSARVRNRLNRNQRLHGALFTDTSLITSSGGAVLPKGLLFGGVDRDVDFQLLPDQEVSVRFVFTVDDSDQPVAASIVEKIGSRGGVRSRRYNIDLATPTPGFVNNATLGVESSVVRARSVSDSLVAPVSDYRDPASPMTVPRPAPDVVTRDPSELPIEVTGRGVTTVMADPMLIDTTQYTVVMPALDFPNRRYTAHMDRFRVIDQQENGGDEPWLAVIGMRGRPGDPANEPAFYMADRSRRFIGPVDWAKRGTSRSLAGNRIQSWRFTKARPYEIHAYVVINFEGDNSSDGERQRAANAIMGKVMGVWAAEMNRSYGFDYDDLTAANRDRIVAEFRNIAERLNRDFDAAANNAHEQFSWSTGDTDEYQGLGSIVWIHVDDAGNPGAAIQGRFNRPLVDSYTFGFGGNYGNVLPLVIETPTQYRLDFEIRADVP